jgi:quercetin dioxygenase-like cupin family protein
MKQLAQVGLAAAVIATAFSLSAPYASAEESPQTKGTISRQTLMTRDLSLSADRIKSNVIRVHFSPGYKTPLHTHEGAGPRYVLKGHLRVEDSGKTETFGPGDVFWETGQAMTIENVGGSDAEMVIFEVQPVN